MWYPFRALNEPEGGDAITMRLVPVLFPSDLGTTHRGQYVPGGTREAPDLFLDMIEGEGVRLARPVAVPIDFPTSPDPEEAELKLDQWVAKSIISLAEAVDKVNADGDFPLILGGDQTALMG